MERQRVLAAYLAVDLHGNLEGLREGGLHVSFEGEHQLQVAPELRVERGEVLQGGSNTSELLVRDQREGDFQNDAVENSDAEKDPEELVLYRSAKKKNRKSDRQS